MGRAVYAVGGNETATRLSGINVARVRLLAFTLAGCTAGMVGILMTARLKGSPNYGAGFELQGIAAAVIGGATLAGGSGNVLSTLVGALTVAVVANGINLNNVSTTWQSIILGVIIVLAVGADDGREEAAAWRRRRRRGPPGGVAPDEPARAGADGQAPEAPARPTAGRER